MYFILEYVIICLATFVLCLLFNEAKKFCSKYNICICRKHDTRKAKAFINKSKRKLRYENEFLMMGVAIGRIKNNSIPYVVAYEDDDD